jgi:hypothetical protein
MRSPKKKTLLFVAISVAVLITIIASYYLFGYLPQKRELVSISTGFIQTLKTSYILPEKYQDHPEQMTDAEIEGMKLEAREAMLLYVTEDSEVFHQYDDSLTRLVEKQITGEIQNKSVVSTVEKVCEVKIYEDTATVYLLVRTDEDKGYIKTTYSNYMIGFVKNNSGNWIVQAYDYAPEV